MKSPGRDMTVHGRSSLHETRSSICGILLRIGVMVMKHQPNTESIESKQRGPWSAQSATLCSAPVALDPLRLMRRQRRTCIYGMGARMSCWGSSIWGYHTCTSPTFELRTYHKYTRVRRNTRHRDLQPLDPGSLLSEKGSLVHLVKCRLVQEVVPQVVSRGPSKRTNMH